jgi:carbon monoxide dehydrogenase subunit G
MRVTRSVHLGSSVDEAWGYLIDWERQAEWMADADWIRVTGPKREDVGVTLSVRTRLYNIPIFTERLEVTAWEPPHRMSIAHRSIVKGTGDWELEPDADGCTFTWTEDVTLPIVGDLVAGIYRPFLGKVMQRSLDSLARELARPEP